MSHKASMMRWSLHAISLWSIDLLLFLSHFSWNGWLNAIRIHLPSEIIIPSGLRQESLSEYYPCDQDGVELAPDSVSTHPILITRIILYDEGD